MTKPIDKDGDATGTRGWSSLSAGTRRRLVMVAQAAAASAIGVPSIQIAEKLGMSRQRLSMAQKSYPDLDQEVFKFISELFRAKDEEIREQIKIESIADANRELFGLTSDAVATVRRILEDPTGNDKTQYQVAKDLLERYLGRPAQDVNINAQLNETKRLEIDPALKDTLDKLIEGQARFLPSPIIDVTPGTEH